MKVWVFLPSNKMLGVRGKSKLLGEVKAIPPIDNLSVGIRSILSAERRPPYKALKHDGPDGPPITKVGVALSVENLRGDVIRSAHS